MQLTECSKQQQANVENKRQEQEESEQENTIIINENTIRLNAATIQHIESFNEHQPTI